MYKFILNLFLFLIIPFFLLGFSFLIESEMNSKRELLIKLLQKENNIIILGDSRSLVDFDYEILQKKFPKYTISNLSIWAKNPQFCYSVYEDILNKKEITNSIIIYGITYPHILNRENLNWKGWSLKEKIGGLLNISRYKVIDFNLKHIITRNGFLNITEQDFGNIESGKNWYSSLENKYKPNFRTQIDYIKKFESTFDKKKGNRFLVCDLPQDTTLQRICSSSYYYAMYKKQIDNAFQNNHLYLVNIKGLNQKKFWYNRNHLNNLGAKTFTPIFCDSLKQRILIKN
mgnify:FL=1